MTNVINKSMDRNDLLTEDARVFISEVSALINTLKSRNLRVSSWYGEFDLAVNKPVFETLNRGFGYQALDDFAYDVDFPWFLMWEMYWLYKNNQFKSGDTLLDLGGSSSLFSFLLASKGIKVTTVDLQEQLVNNGNEVARAMNWELENYKMDMRELNFDKKFDHITSVCVFEHIPMFDRVSINRRMVDILKPGGTFSITFDYRNPSKAAEINSPADIQKQFIEPSGLILRGNKEFNDSNTNYLLHPFYHPLAPFQVRIREVLSRHFAPAELFKRKQSNDYTFGALFMEKSENVM